MLNWVCSSNGSEKRTPFSVKILIQSIKVVENNSVKLIDLPYQISKCAIVKLQIELIMPSKETRQNRICTEWFWSYMKFHNRQEESMVKIITWGVGGCGCGERESEAGQGQKESDIKITYLNPHLPHTICKNKFQMN